MLRNYFPFYEIALRLGVLLSRAGLLKSGSQRDISKNDPDSKALRELLDMTQLACDSHGLTHYL